MGGGINIVGVEDILILSLAAQALACSRGQFRFSDDLLATSLCSHSSPQSQSDTYRSPLIRLISRRIPLL